jgi:2-keto-3-deoxy-L-rhamnonate aldolase RhmA
MDSFRTRLSNAASPLLASFITLPRVEIVEMYAAAGFDTVILDCEHGAFGVEVVPPLAASAHGAGLSLVVRVPDLRPQAIGAALDAGADGVLVPHVQSRAAAAMAVSACRFEAGGSRGANPYVRAAGYSGGRDFFTTADASVACLAMIEGPEGIASLDDILQVSGLDAVFVGPVDLSNALGKAGDTEDPAVVESVAGVIERATRRGVAVAVFAPTVDAATRWIGAGARLIALAVDTGLILNAFSEQVAELREALMTTPATR